MRDLFGNEPLETSNSKGVSVSLFDHAAEHEALETGRPLSQELAELRHPEVEPIGPGSLLGENRNPLAVYPRREYQTCRACGATFDAAPRADSTCNLCRRKAL